MRDSCVVGKIPRCGREIKRDTSRERKRDIGTLLRDEQKKGVRGEDKQILKFFELHIFGGLNFDPVGYLNDL